MITKKNTTRHSWQWTFQVTDTAHPKAEGKEMVKQFHGITQNSWVVLCTKYPIKAHKWTQERGRFTESLESQKGEIWMWQRQQKTVCREVADKNGFRKIIPAAVCRMTSSRERLEAGDLLKECSPNSSTMWGVWSGQSQRRWEEQGILRPGFRLPTLNMRGLITSFGSGTFWLTGLLFWDCRSDLQVNKKSALNHPSYLKIKAN